MSSEADKIRRAIAALKTASITRQELTTEYQMSIRSHRKNGKLLRDMHGNGKAASASTK